MANMDGCVSNPINMCRRRNGILTRYYSQVVSDDDKKALETLSGSIIKEKQPFERLEMTKDELLEMFKYSKYKEYFIQQRVPDGTKSTVYRCGPLIDLCRGPHVPNTGNIKAFAVLRVRSFFPSSVLRGSAREMRCGILISDDRALQPTGWVTAKTSPSSASPVSRSPTKRPLRNTRRSSRRLPSATTARLVLTRSSSSLTRSHLVPPSSFPMAHAFTTPSWTSSRPSTRSASSKRS